MTAVNAYIQEGKALDYTNSTQSDIAYLDILEGTDRIFVAACGIPMGEVGSVYTEGVFQFPSSTSEAFTFGQKLYYDSTNKVLTSTATSNKYVGYATEAKTESASAANAKLVA